MDGGDSMDDNNGVPNVRYAIVRFRDIDESARLRHLLRQHGYEEPTWLDSYGQQLQMAPTIIPGLNNPAQSTATSVIRSLSSARTIDGILTGGLSGGGSFLTLPTVLVDPISTVPISSTRCPRIVIGQQQQQHPLAQVPSASVVLPLAPGAIPSTRAPSGIVSPSSSSRLSALGERESSEMTMSSPEPRTTSPVPMTSPIPSLDPDVVTEDVSDAPMDGVAQPPPSAGAVGISTAARAWVSPAPLRPRGKKPKPHEDPNVYYTCELCKNRILGTRVSNLQNHVRRHSTLKQFQCCYCEYAHNEIAKVRLHMTNNHKDTESAPVNNLTPDMQAVWRSLFRECFPTRAQRRRGVRATPHHHAAASSTTATSSVVRLRGGASYLGESSATTKSSSTTGLASTSNNNNTDDRSNPCSGSSTTRSSSTNVPAIPLSMRRRRHHRRPPPRLNQTQRNKKMKSLFLKQQQQQQLQVQFVRTEYNKPPGGDYEKMKKDDDRSTKRGDDDAFILDSYLRYQRLEPNQRLYSYWSYTMGGVNKDQNDGGGSFLVKKRHPHRSAMDFSKCRQYWTLVGG